MNKTVIIVDDHTLFSQSLAKLVNSFEGFEVIQVFKNGKELVKYYNENNMIPDLVLLDIRMPIMDGIETMKWFKENYPNQIVLALSMENNEDIIITMINSGCRGYLLKDMEPDEFENALDLVLESGYYFNEETNTAMAHELKSTKKLELTAREIEFLQLACSELTYKEVATSMNLSPKTIDGYRENVFQKFNVKSRVGLVLYALKNDFVRI